MDERGRVVVGIDGSPGSRDTRAYALREAVRRDAVVEAVAAFTPPDYLGYETWPPLYGPRPGALDEIRDCVRRDAGCTVQEVTGQLPAETAAPPVTVRVVAGRARAAQRGGASGPAGGGQSRPRGFRSMVLSSVSLACALHSPCLVRVILPPKQATTDEPAIPRATASGS